MPQWHRRRSERDGPSLLYSNARRVRVSFVMCNPGESIAFGWGPLPMPTDPPAQKWNRRRPSLRNMTFSETATTPSTASTAHHANSTT